MLSVRYRPEGMPTVAEMIAFYEELHIPTLADPRPVRTRLRLYLSRLASHELNALTTVDILRWYTEIRNTSIVQANASLTLLRHLYTKAGEWNLYKGENPAKLVKIKRLPARTRYAKPEELSALFAVLASEPVMHRFFFGLILFVSCRPGEAERARPEQFSFWIDPRTETPLGTWTKPKTKNGLSHTVPLPPIVARLGLDHFANLPSDCPWVFPGQTAYASRSTWHQIWARIRSIARIPDLRRHDLRRTCATYLLDGGMDLLTLSKAVLNHTDLSSTATYAQPLTFRVRQHLTANSERMIAFAFSEKGSPT